MTHGADKGQRRVGLVEYMKIEVGHTVVAHFDVGKERQRPVESGAKEDVVNVGKVGAVCEKNRSAFYLGDSGSHRQVGIPEGGVTKVDIELLAAGDVDIPRDLGDVGDHVARGHRGTHHQHSLNNAISQSFRSSTT